MEGHQVNEWTIIYAVILSAGLFAAGGTEVKKTGRGYKWIRRFILPALLCLIAWPFAPYWAVIGFGATLCVFLHLGYGDRCSWPKRAFIFAGYGLSSLWIGWSWWAVLTPAACCALFFLSNLKSTASDFQWKLCELSFGFLIGCTFVAAILNRWSF